MAPDISSQFDSLADQFAMQIRNGLLPEVEQYAKEYPEMAEKIRRLFPVLQMMEKKGNPVQDLSEAGLLAAELNELEPPPPLRQLGDYRIVREIGRGGMGIVFEAQQESLGRRVALKLLPESAQFDERRQQRFQQEALASAKLHHTNIVPVFGVGTHDDTAYFVMQFIDGQPLDSVITELSRIRSSDVKQGTDSTDAIVHAAVSTIASGLNERENWPSGEQNPSRQDEATGTGNSAETNASIDNSSSASAIANDGIYWRNIAKLGVQVADALVHAHSKKIFHRDIKPSNLLIDKSGCAWVTDFGLAKYSDSPDLTRTGEVVGTLRYMSPEQLEGTADHRCDVFGLGLTLYELTALKPAYDASERGQLMQQVIDASPPQLRSINRRIPKDLETIIQKCIAAEPQKRYQDAGDLAGDLSRFLVGQPVRARRINSLQRIVKWCKRRPAIAALVTSLAASLVVGVAGIAWQWQKTADALTLATANLDEASRQSEKAQEHFGQARESVNRFFTVVSQDRLLKEPGLQKLRRELLGEALDYHKEFAKRYSDDDGLKIELGKSLYFVVDIEGTLSGNPELANSLNEPINVFSKLIQSDPKNPEHYLWKARCLAMKSSLLRRSDATSSLATLRDVNEQLRLFRTKFPNNLAGLEALAENHQMLGLASESIETATQESTKSLEHYANALEIRNQMIESRPDDSRNAAILAGLHRDLGITFRRQGDFDQAVVHFDKAMEKLESIVQREPKNDFARKMLGSSANSVGYFYSNGTTDDELQTALDYFEKSKEQYQWLADRNPLIIEYRDGVARAALGAGGVLQVQGKFDEALANRKFAADYRKKLCLENPNAPYLRSSWAISLNGVGSTLRDMNEIDQALKFHKMAHEQHVTVVHADPTQPILRLRLIDGLIQLSRAHSAGEFFSEAMADIESIDQYTLDHFSKPHFLKGREYTLIACKIANLTEEQSEEQLAIQDACLEKAKSSLTTAHELGFDVYKWSQSDADFKYFSQYQEGSEILSWIEENLGS